MTVMVTWGVQVSGDAADPDRQRDDDGRWRRTRGYECWWPTLEEQAAHNDDGQEGGG